MKKYTCLLFSSSSHLNALAGISVMPGALLFLSLPIARTNSFIVIGESKSVNSSLCWRNLAASENCSLLLLYTFDRCSSNTSIFWLSVAANYPFFIFIFILVGLLWWHQSLAVSLSMLSTPRLENIHCPNLFCLPSGPTCFCNCNLVFHHFCCISQFFH